MKQESKSSCIKAYSFVKNNTDLYSTPVQFYFKSYKKVSSIVGLLATWLVVLLIMGFSLYKGYILLQKTQFSIQMTTILNPVNYSNPELVQLNEYGFDIAFNLDKEYGPEHGALIVSKMKRIVPEEGEAAVYYEQEDLEVEPCGEEGFNHTDKQEIHQKEVDTLFYCIKNKDDLAIGGLWRASFYQYLQILLVPCQNSSDSDVICRPQEEIEEHFAEVSLTLLVSNYYFDKDDLEAPIKSYIDDSIYFTIPPGSKLVSDIFVAIDEAKMSTSLLPWSSPQLSRFAVLDRYENHITSHDYWENHSFIQLTIRQDFWAKLYQKEIYSFTDYVSDVGGMLNSLYGCGRIIVFLFLDSILFSNLLQELFSTKSSSKTEKNDLSAISRENLPAEILKEIQQRKPFRFSKLQLMKQIFCCRLLCMNDRASRLYVKGRKLLKNEFDITKLFQMIRELKILKSVLLTKEENFLLKFHKKHLLDSDDSEIEEDNNQYRVKNGRLLTSKGNPVLLMSDVQMLQNRLQWLTTKNLQCKKLQILLKGILEKRKKSCEESKIEVSTKGKKMKHLKPLHGPLPHMKQTERHAIINEDNNNIFISGEPEYSFQRYAQNDSQTHTLKKMRQKFKGKQNSYSKH